MLGDDHRDVDVGVLGGQSPSQRIVADPPLLVAVGDLVSEGALEQVEAQIRRVLAGYRDTLPEDRRRLLDAFEFAGLARKVVGVGSVGTRCWIVLLTGRDHTDPLLLQVKEAGPSVLAPEAGGDNHGRRVVRGPAAHAGGQRHLPGLAERERVRRTGT